MLKKVRSAEIREMMEPLSSRNCPVRMTAVSRAQIKNDELFDVCAGKTSQSSRIRDRQTQGKGAGSFSATLSIGMTSWSPEQNICIYETGCGGWEVGGRCVRSSLL